MYLLATQSLDDPPGARVGLHNFVTKVSLFFSFLLFFFLLQCTKVSQDATADDDYVKAYCWASGTYAIEDRDGNAITDDKDKFHISYYQWVPVVLAL